MNWHWSPALDMAPAERDRFLAAPGPVPCESVVWVHDAALSPADAALKANPTAAVGFAFDERSLRREPRAFHRLAFVFDGVVELMCGLPNPVKLVTLGDPATDLAAAAKHLGAATVHVTDHPNPWVRETAATLRKTFAVTEYARPVLTEYAEEPRRFSRYWDKSAAQVLGYAPKGGKKFQK